MNITPIARLVELYKASRASVGTADYHASLMNHAQEIEKLLTTPAERPADEESPNPDLGPDL